MNLLPYSMYKQLGLGELKPTSITLSLADRSIKIPKGTIEDVLIQVDKFYYPVDFVVLDTKPVAVGANHVPIILGSPFLATSNAFINFRNGVMQHTFGNMTLELNIFHLSKKHMQPVEDDCEEVCIIDTILEEQANEQQVQDVLTQELSECLVKQQDPQCMSLVHGCWRKKSGNSTFIDWRRGKGISTAGSQAPACGIKICIFGRKQAVSSCNIVTTDHSIGRQSAAPPQEEQASFGVEHF